MFVNSGAIFFKLFCNNSRNFLILVTDVLSRQMCLLVVFPLLSNENLDKFFETSQCADEKGNFINGYISL
jgi:hypothetical protein